MQTESLGPGGGAMNVELRIHCLDRIEGVIKVSSVDVIGGWSRWISRPDVNEKHRRLMIMTPDGDS